MLKNDSKHACYHIPKDFKENLDEEDIEKNKAVIELLEKLQGEDITY